MTRRKRHSFGRRYPKELSKFEMFQWVLFFFLATTFFVFIFAWRLITHCIFTWPIRFDFGACWNEQVQPAEQGAIEKAGPFAPL